jgi:hypothetical protein
MKTYEVTITLAGKKAHETLIVLSHSVSCIGEQTILTPADQASIRTLLQQGAKVEDSLYSINTSICTFRPLPEKKPVAAQ